MNGIDIDPYKILGISQDSTLEKVKEAYRALAREHHPDKGGNADKFKIMKSAFKMIVDNIKKGTPIPKTQSSTFSDLKDSSQNFVAKQLEPHEFFGQTKPLNPNKEFNANSFNQRFNNNKNNGEDYLLSVADKDYRENRTKEQLLSEHAAIDGDLGQIKPMFSGKDCFNPNAFNRMFEHINGKPETKITSLQKYDEPIALTSGLQPFTEIDDNYKILQTGNLSSLQYGSLDDSFGGYKNPNSVDNNLLNTFKKQPDITDVNTLEGDYHTKMKNKLNEYNSAQFNFHQPPANPNQLPDQLKATKSTMDKISQKGLSDVYSKKLSERNQMTNQLRYGSDAPPTDRLPAPQLKSTINDRNLPINNQHHAMPLMEYPRNSNNPSTPSYNPPLPSVTHTIPIPNQNNNATDDYFVKIPNATQPYNSNYNPYAQPAQPVPNYNNIPNFNPVEQMQKQLSDLQKTVDQQNKIIRGLHLKKKNKSDTKN